MGDISAHFDQAEFTCNHCGQLHPDNPCPPIQVLNWLETIRDEFGGKPMNINSGYRCPTHNSNVGGAKSSYHMRGQAVDFWISGVDPASAFGFASKLIGDEGGVGKYNSFTHIDNRGFMARW